MSELLGCLLAWMQRRPRPSRAKALAYSPPAQGPKASRWPVEGKHDRLPWCLTFRAGPQCHAGCQAVALSLFTNISSELVTSSKYTGSAFRNCQRSAQGLLASHGRVVEQAWCGVTEPLLFGSIAAAAQEWCSRTDQRSHRQALAILKQDLSLASAQDRVHFP